MSINKPIILLLFIYLQSIICCGEHVEAASMTVHMPSSSVNDVTLKLK